MTGIRAQGAGWTVFAEDEALRPWLAAAHAHGLRVLADPQMRETWLQCEGTWFVGVDALDNAPDGTLDGVALRGRAVDAVSPLLPLHRAQLSVTYPGYPRPRDGEGEAAFRYRRNRDAAHVDGITVEGPERRRVVTEFHAYILGLPITQADPDAAPLVIWDGSHKIMGAALRDAPEGADVTEIYQQARRRCFEECTRIVLPAKPGEAILLHRHLLHGITPWAEGAQAPQEGRMIAYFRPEFLGGHADWCHAESPQFAQ
ncbi:MAG: hypothetical protein N4A53_02190 [Pelagimonas sp.]|jgi:hypothetical protein|nr:hypothetical protein [Pelagimonas sp.]